MTPNAALALLLQRLNGPTRQALLTLARGTQPHSIAGTTRARLARLGLTTGTQTLRLTSRGTYLARIIRAGKLA